MKPVVYIEFPEAPTAYIGEAPNCFAVNLCCSDMNIRSVPHAELPKDTLSKESLFEELEALLYLFGTNGLPAV